jgi:hypothetical protein
MEERTRRERERRGMCVLLACSGSGSAPDADVGVGVGAGRRERDWPMVALEQQGRGSLRRWPKAELDVSEDDEEGVADVLDEQRRGVVDYSGVFRSLVSNFGILREMVQPHA